MGYALRIQTALQFTTIECGECGIIFAVQESFRSKLQETGQGWYCPNGHCRVYTETTVQKLQKELDSQREETERQRRLRIDAERRTIAQRAVVTKLKRRVNHGVCPHCSRTVAQMARHIRAKHPEALSAAC